MNALNELRELDASLEGEEDIDNNGGPNTAMRVRQVLAEVIPVVAELIEAVVAVYGEPCVDGEQAADDPCPPSCMQCRILAALAKVQGGEA